MYTRDEIIRDLNMSAEEEKLWKYCYQNTRMSDLITGWGKNLLCECKQGLERYRERGCVVSKAANDYALQLSAILSYCFYDRLSTAVLSATVDKLVLAIMRKIGSGIQEELYPRFGDTYMEVDRVDDKIVFNVIKMEDYRSFLDQQSARTQWETAYDR